ncbi:Glycyl-tRNA synthetase beta chain [Dissulfuribacter thermophilus]|uniref:Glycine--tRNA ligase beta subunit n=1 Tax=Dissulfuribacter thermophilus TaxID=1156395 RepID=A0A1B9F6M8_9BACT|nr:glycine--tRNA ligase subunit beta [Dissulfuribacter thermophilus]OCC15504.1 Glycyl-tRNA synthetase beta chain [Dissulfuribacter thermophilus]
MQKNLIVEIGTEEIPAGFIPSALDALKNRAEERLKDNRLQFKDVRTLGTPRRLTLWVEGLNDRQDDLVERVMGPPKKVAFDDSGNPTKAAEGFAKRNNVTIEDLEVIETERGPYCCINKVIEGRPTRDVLEELLPQLITEIPFAKNMKWEDSGFRFARPIRWLVAVFGEDTLSFSLAGIVSGNESYGHRFHAPGAIKVSSDLKSYEEALNAAFVVVDQEKRREAIREQATRLAEEAGGRLLFDEDLLDLNTFLVEYPYCILGSFEEAFLALPEEVLITVMKEHQKYFAVVDGDGKLLPHFISVNNISPKDPDLLKKGHQRVLRARLNDARFFFEEDLKRPLEDYVKDLAGVIFHKELGSLLDKTNRIKALAGYISSIVAPESRATVERAAILSKADLVTEMVGEFPDLQGVMGRVYAQRSGEDEAVALAIYEHYLPKSSGGELPSSLEGAILSIADRADTICSTFALGMKPTGGQDPFGLRRHALGILHILEDRGISISLEDLIEKAFDILTESTGLSISKIELKEEILTFFRTRLKNELVSRGLRPDTVEAALKACFDEPVDAILRARAIEAVRTRPEFEPLSIAFKRCMNILKGETRSCLKEELLKEPAEVSLYSAIKDAREKVLPLLNEKRHEDAMLVLLGLKPAIDRFFDEVLVMAEDEAIRANRLALIYEISSLFLSIGDLSAISG